MFTKKILAAAITSQPSANGVADAIDFDGTNDHLSRSSDLVGNTDGKTFTLSVWLDRRSASGAEEEYILSNGSNRFALHMTRSSGLFTLDCYGATGTLLLRVTGFAAKDYLGANTSTHILISSDISVGNKTAAYAYVNDIAVSASGITWYANQNIDFTQTTWGVGYSPSTPEKWKGRIAHLFLDKTSRDLSVEANRRLFITADRKPTPKATLQALNPILYLPLDDPTQAGKNLGTGGDFALNGVVARSGRGPNQFNAAYSDLNGSAQYLSRTSLTGVSDGKQFTFSCVLNSNNVSPNPICFASGANGRFIVQTNGGRLQVVAADSSNSFNLNVTVAAADTYVVGRNYVITVSIDLTSTSKRHIFINGVDKTSSATWTTYTNSNIGFSIGTSPTYQIGAQVSSATHNGRLGNLFFDTRYIDLSVPANLAKFVTGTGIDAKPVDLGANGELPFGTPPLIYLPMYGNNAGKNYGTGGDFTVNSGPFAGARGPNEFWGNKADFVPNSYLSASASLGLSKTFSSSFSVTFDDTGTGRNVFSACGTDILNASIQIQRDGTTNKLLISCQSSGGATVLYAESNTTFSAGTYYIQLCIDLSDPNKRKVFSNGVEVAFTYTNYSNTAIASTSFVTVGCYCSNSGSSLANYLDGKLSEFYFTTEYIDFSQEANRLKFRDAFGNPVDLRPQIAAGTLPNPAIYMRFDPSNFGKNSGTGGDFVVNGTITDGGQL